MIKIKPMASSIKEWLNLSWDTAKKSPCRPLNMAHLYLNVLVFYGQNCMVKICRIRQIKKYFLIVIEEIVKIAIKRPTSDIQATYD